MRVFDRQDLLDNYQFFLFIDLIKNGIPSGNVQPVDDYPDLLKPVSLYLPCFPGTDLLQAVLRAVLIIRRVFPGRRLISSDNSYQSIRENVNP
jgi:hypothetical protein